MSKGTKLEELKDGVYSDGALDRVKVRVLGLPLTLNAYVNILSALGAGGYLDDPGQDDILINLVPDVSDPSERREVAIDHLRKSLKRAQQFQNAIDTPVTPPDGLKLYLSAGDAVPTHSNITYNRNKGELTYSGTAPGDGTVTRSSALLDERIGNERHPRLQSPIVWSNVTFLFPTI
jgi:hypothetical protein